MKLFNTLTQVKEDFIPINPDLVSIYTCGPTVYDSLHIGNWSAYIYWDILVRTLVANGYRVNRVINITDVGHLVSDSDYGEDKLQKSANEKNQSAWDIANFYSNQFLNDYQKLNLITPNHIAKATEFIDQQLYLIRQLKSRNMTYQTNDGIYFDISKFKNYASFAHLDLAGSSQSRIAKTNFKKNPQDFAVWKFSPDDQTRDMQWPTPIDLIDDGIERMGFPGWHIECSAIIMSLLGESIDIHTGGIDHIPIHHTNEIAQSESVTGNKLATYWLHNNHLLIDNAKISKSLGNGITLDQLSKQGFSANDIKLFVLQSNYHSQANYTTTSMLSAQDRIHNWMNFALLRHQTHDTLISTKEKVSNKKMLKLPNLRSELLTQLSDDLNTVNALKIINDYFHTLGSAKLESIDNDKLTADLESVNELLGIDLLSTTPDLGDDLKAIIIKRQRARELENWDLADQLRDQLLAHNVAVNDTPNGPVWSYIY